MAAGADIDHVTVIERSRWTMGDGRVGKARLGTPRISDVSNTDLHGPDVHYVAMYETADIPAGSSMLTITGVAAGMATTTVTADDRCGRRLRQADHHGHRRSGRRDTGCASP